MKFQQCDMCDRVYLLLVILSKQCRDHDEMPHRAAFHLGLHCSPNYTFRVTCLQGISCFMFFDIQLNLS